MREGDKDSPGIEAVEAAEEETPAAVAVALVAVVGVALRLSVPIGASPLTLLAELLRL